MTVGQLLELLANEDPNHTIAIRVGYKDHDITQLLHYDDGTLRLH